MLRKNSSLSYNIDSGELVISSVHIKLLKEYVTRDTPQTVKRVTTVLEPNTESDIIEGGYAEIVIRGRVEDKSRDKDISEWVTEFSVKLTKEPGLTLLMEFTMDTRDHAPIAQWPYNTPLSLRQSVDKEIDRLLAKGYIRESNSNQAFPMVKLKMKMK